MQEKESKIKMPILALLGIAIFLLLALSIFSIYALQRRHIEDEIQNRMEEVWQLEHVELDKDAELLEGLIDFLQKDEVFRRAWQGRDREAMAEYGSIIFDDIRSKFPVTHFCLHELDGSCFINLRNISTHQDCKDEKEYVMQKASEEGKVFSGIELGKCGSVVLRVVYPWIIDGKPTGYIILGENLKMTTTKLKETLGVEVFFTIDKSLVNRTHWAEHISRTGVEDNWDLFKNFLISHSTMARMPKELESYLKELVSCNEHEHLSSFMRLSLDDRHYEAGFLPLIDVSGRDIGDIIVLTDITKILAHIRVISSGLIAASVFMGIALFIFFYVFLSRIENNLVSAHQDLRTEISERKKVQQALQKNEEHLRTILDSSPDAILQIDKEMKITWVNKAATESDPKALGRYCFECCAEKTNEPCEDCVCLKAFESSQLERGIIKKECDGVTSYWDEIAVPLRNRQGQFDRAIVIARNVTERQQVENTRRNLLEVLEAKNWELENIIHVTSHDLRTPLVTICGFSEELSYSCQQIQSLFSQEESTPETKQQANAIVFEDIPESVDLIRASAAKMQSLLDGLIRMAKLGFSATEIVRLDMNKEIEEIIKTLGFQARQSKAKIEADNLPLCYGDRSQIYQVFFNLISNAIKYLDPSRPGIVRISGHEEEGESVYCVEDNGIGLAEQNFSNVFKMFYRINPDHDEGEGIGLAVVRRIVNRHQGRVWIESEEGKGSRFYVSLPQTS